MPKYHMRSLNLTKNAVLAVALGVGTPFACADYNPGKLGEAAGAYVIATDMMQRLQSSRCGYVFKKSTYRFDEAVKEVMQYLRPGDRKEFQAFLIGEENMKARQDNTRYIEDWLRSMAREGQDEKTACGMLFSHIGTVYSKATKGWEYAKQHYTK